MLNNCGGSEAFETSLRLCKDPDKWVRYFAVGVLADLSDPRAVAPLLEMAQRRNSDLPAAYAISNLPFSAATELLPYAKSKKDDLRHGVVGFCTRWFTEDPRCHLIVMNALADEAEFIRRDAQACVREHRPELFNTYVLGEPSNKRRQKRIRQHATNLASPDSKISQRAEASLIRYYGKEAVDACIAACASENPAVRFRAVWVLGKTKAPEAFDTILALCDDPDKQVRYDAVAALGVLSDPRSVAPLVAFAIRNDPDLPGLYGLTKLRPNTVDQLLEFATHESAEIRTAVLYHCARWTPHDSRCRGVVERGLNDPDTEIRELARRCLASD